MTVAHARELLATVRAGWSLPQPFYVDEDLFALDMEHVFVPNWVFVGHTCEVAAPGDWMRVDIGADSVIIVRGTDDGVRAFFNTCRHRGSLICLESSGHSSSSHLSLPPLDVRPRWLVRRREVPRPRLRRQRVRLAPVHCRTVGGYVFICLADEPPDFDSFERDVTPFLAPHGMDELKVAHVERLVEQCNWKLVMENNRECYHCVGAHPELMVVIDEFDGPGSKVTPRDIATKELAVAAWERAGIVHEQTTAGGNEWRAVRLPFTNDAAAMTIDGSPACSKVLGTLDDGLRSLGSVRLLHLPNTWNHVQSDHVVSFSVLPISASETMLVTRWLVHRDAVEGVDYDFDHLTRVWVATNRQDATLAENNQRGIATRGYRPGPYAPFIEAGTADFTSWYTDQLRQRLPS